jgi:hypothetical protein
MAVYCGVCAVRISSAADNGGAFPTHDFGGWESGSKIHDTCVSCAGQLMDAVAAVARRIREDNLDRVVGLRARLLKEADVRLEYDRRKDEALRRFDEEWAKKERGG